MKRAGTALAVGAVSLIGLLALGDALRGHDDASAPGPSTTRTTRAPPETAAGELAARQITGVLYATVRDGDGCRLELLELPSLERSEPGIGRSCRIRVSPSGRVALGNPCPAPSLNAQTDTGLRAFRGCAPAWRPDGRLTFVRNGAVVELREPCASVKPCLGVLVPRGRVRGRVLELAWLREERLAALVVRRPRPRLNRSIVVFVRGRVVADEGPCCPDVSYLKAVSDSRLVLRTGRPGDGAEFLGFDAKGAFATAQAVPEYLSDGRAVAVSPDGAWMASTLGSRVEIYRAGLPRPLDPVEVDLQAVDLGWGAG